MELNLNDEHKQDLGDSEVRTNVMVPSKKILICWTKSNCFFYREHKIVFLKIRVRVHLTDFRCMTWIIK